jgi:hypothetical protein
MGEHHAFAVVPCVEATCHRGLFADVAAIKCLNGWGWGLTFSGYFTTDEEREPRRATEKGRMALRATRIKTIDHTVTRWSVPRIFSVTLRGSRSSSVVKSDRRGSADHARVAPDLSS